MHESFDRRKGKAPKDAGDGRGTRWVFATARYDESTGELTVAGDPRPLDHGSNELLLCLLHHAGEIVPKDVLLQAGWPGRVTSDSSLTKAIHRLRASLDDPDGHVVATVHGYGYRLGVRVSREAIPQEPRGTATPSDIAVVAKTSRWSRGHARWLGGAAILAILALGWVWSPGTPPSTAAAATSSGPSIAVLPLRDLSQDGSQAYLADGITEELLNRLAQVSRLRVIGKSSVFSLQGEKLEPQALGELLHVTHYLEGSVRSAGQRLRVAIQLRKASDGTTLWSETYDRELGDVLVLQDEIAAAVTRHLELQLLGITPSRRVHPEAYALVQKARRDFRLGLAYKPETLVDLEKAVRLDPDYDEAWYVLATTYMEAYVAGRMPLQEAKQRARETSQAALQRNPRNALVLANLAFDALYYDHDPAEAIRRANEAMDLDPTDLRILWIAASISFDVGNQEEAIAAMAFVADRDPLHAHSHHVLGMRYFMLHKYGEALVSFRTTLALDPDNKYARIGLADALLMSGDAKAALEAYAAVDSEVHRIGGRCAALHALGKQRESDELRERLLRFDPADSENIDRVAGTLAVRGEADAAFEWLARLKPLEGNVLDMDPFYGKLHGDARWLPLLHVHGRAPQQIATLPRSTFRFTAPDLLVDRSSLP